jgi:hypothetical protein
LLCYVLAVEFVSVVTRSVLQHELILGFDDPSA